MQKELDTIEKQIQGLSAEESLNVLARAFPGQVTFSTSLGYEDQVVAHMLFSNSTPVSVFTLDTGRLFPETYSVLQSTIDRYKQPIRIFSPQTVAVEKMVSEKGPFSFYKSVEERKNCCFIRKVEPLKRALLGNKIWITGIRAEQSGNRKGMPALEWDESNTIIKFHPLINWTLDEIKGYIKRYNIPYNSLHDKGFVSIGCGPCTRAIKQGEDFRAGRWWWEQNDKKECGLHTH